MKAKRKEELERIGSNIVDGELDALYLQAIEAKLGLLEDYWLILYGFYWMVIKWDSSIITL